MYANQSVNDCSISWKKDLYTTTTQFIMFVEFQKYVLSLQQVVESESQQSTKVSPVTEFEEFEASRKTAQERLLNVR